MIADPLCDIFIDESSQNNHAYLVIGGVMVGTEDVPTFDDRIYNARLPELPKGELKWTKVSKAKLPAYKRVVDVFFDSDKGHTIHFHSLFVETAKQNHSKFNNGSEEIGFSKEIFQLAMKFGRLYDGRFHVYPDQRSTKQSTADLRLMLNRATMRKEPERDWPYRRVQFRDSASTPLLQLTDIMTGAIAAHLNGHYKLPGASQPKLELMRYVLARAGVKDPIQGTARKGKFTIWPRQLQ